MDNHRDAQLGGGLVNRRRRVTTKTHRNLGTSPAQNLLAFLDRPRKTHREAKRLQIGAAREGDARNNLQLKAGFRHEFCLHAFFGAHHGYLVAAGAKFVGGGQQGVHMTGGAPAR